MKYIISIGIFLTFAILFTTSSGILNADAQKVPGPGPFDIPLPPLNITESLPGFDTGQIIGGPGDGTKERTEHGDQVQGIIQPGSAADQVQGIIQPGPFTEK